jgi:flagellar hook-length control protein FliK
MPPAVPVAPEPIVAPAMTPALPPIIVMPRQRELDASPTFVTPADVSSITVAAGETSDVAPIPSMPAADPTVLLPHVVARSFGQATAHAVASAHAMLRDPMPVAAISEAARAMADVESLEDGPIARPRARDTVDEAAPSTGVIAPRAETMAHAVRPEGPDTEGGRVEHVRHPVEQIATRLGEIRLAGRHELFIRLDPPDLGGVRVEARLDGGRLHVHIHTEHVATGELLAESLPRLRESLSLQGFVPAQVSVHVGLDGGGAQPNRNGQPAPATPPPFDEPVPRAQTAPSATLTGDRADLRLDLLA